MLLLVVGESMAGRRHDSLLHPISVPHQQSLNCDQNTIHEGVTVVSDHQTDQVWQPDMKNCVYKQAVKISLEVKKFLIDNNKLEVTQVTFRRLHLSWDQSVARHGHSTGGLHRLAWRQSYLTSWRVRGLARNTLSVTRW